MASITVLVLNNSFISGKQPPIIPIDNNGNKIINSSGESSAAKKNTESGDLDIKKVHLDDPEKFDGTKDS